MSRIATLTAVLTMLVAPAAFAGPIDLRSPDAVTPVRITASGQDLRSPDAVTAFVPTGRTLSPSVSSQPAPADGGSDWGIAALIAAAIAACAGLAVMLRRHLDVGRPVGV